MNEYPIIICFWTTLVINDWALPFNQAKAFKFMRQTNDWLVKPKSLEFCIEFP